VLDGDCSSINQVNVVVQIWSSRDDVRGWFTTLELLGKEPVTVLEQLVRLFGCCYMQLGMLCFLKLAGMLCFLKLTGLIVC
jgi:hypothetical protein